MVPEEGWTQENFEGEDREDLRQDMLMVRRAAVARGLRNLSPSLSKLLKGHVERVIEAALHSFSRLYGIPVKGWVDYRKEDFDFNVPNEAVMWATAIEQELARAGVEIVATVTPGIQSTADDVFGKVNLLLGAKPTRAQVQSLGVRVREIATRVTRINDTTRQRLQNTIAEAIRNGKTVFETADIIRRRIPQIASNRVPTIVRTEMGEAADEATKHAMKESGVVTHFDVIGCEAIEPGIPTYRGVPTCNITGVPIRDERMIRFHPNHTGCIVAAAFYQSDGSVPDIPMHQGVGAGIPAGGAGGPSLTIGVS